MAGKSKNSIPTGTPKRPSARSEEERRGMAAQERVQKGQVSRARQGLVCSPLTPKNEEILRELRERRQVLDFAPPALLEFNFKLFSNCLRQRGRHQDRENARTKCRTYVWITKKPFNCCIMQPTSLPEGMFLVVWAIVSLWQL